MKLFDSDMMGNPINVGDFIMCIGGRGSWRPFWYGQAWGKSNTYVRAIGQYPAFPPRKYWQKHDAETSGGNFMENPVNLTVIEKEKIIGGTGFLDKAAVAFVENTPVEAFIGWKDAIGWWENNKDKKLGFPTLEGKRFRAHVGKEVSIYRIQEISP